MQEKIGNLLYLGERCELWVNRNQTVDFKYAKGKFWVSGNLANNPAKLNEVYENFCRSQLSAIIDNIIAKFRTRKVSVELDYTNGAKVFKRKVKTSVNEYLKMVGFSQDIQYKIGSFKKEWGINQTDPTNKHFVLYFSSDLIKFDDGENATFIVVHQLTHIFHKDHDESFNRTFEQLYPTKQSNTGIFNFQFGQLIGIRKSGGLNLLVLFIVSLLVVFSFFNFLQDIRQIIFG